MAMFQEERHQVMRAHMFFVCFYYFLEITSNLQEKKYKEYLCTLYPDIPAIKI